MHVVCLQREGRSGRICTEALMWRDEISGHFSSWWAILSYDSIYRKDGCKLHEDNTFAVFTTIAQRLQQGQAWKVLNE